ncbi:hypothetical protein Ccrd_013730 [Cynara cardunculus var. scolymus]|uniref:Uncharacterized protein n=1 Tax=Cynara cardunculus var. scolymus TaxID=59895 RepID=A0A118K4Q2_CYNCS|nr:hypothetical protein Ccrd_013730 [Cynara cardunculus var. scolymus]
MEEKGKWSGDLNSFPKAWKLKQLGREGVKSGQARSESRGGNGWHPSIFTGGSSATSPTVNVLPIDNICLSGKDLKAGTDNYGDNNIMGGGSAIKSIVVGGREENPILGNLNPSELMQQGVVEDRLPLLVDVTSAFRSVCLLHWWGVSGAGKTTLMDVLAARKLVE